MSLRSIIAVAALLSACAPLAHEVSGDAYDDDDAGARELAPLEPDAGDAGEPPPDFVDALAPLERTYARIHGAFVGCDGARVANAEASTDWIAHPVTGKCSFTCRDAKLANLCAHTLGGACVGASYQPGAPLVDFCVSR